MRVQTACLACRSRRQKCVLDAGYTRCTYCRSKALQCTGNRATSTLPRPLHPSRPSHLVPKDTGCKEQASDLSPLSICLELVALYFDLIHDQFHTLFHRPSFTDIVARGEAPPVILYAMLALSARFSGNVAFTNTDLWGRSSGYAKKSAALLNLGDLSLCTIQVCILLGTVCRSEGDGAAESVYYSVASRIANILDLANRPASNAVEREVNIRVWWTLLKIDTWSSAGVSLPRQMVHKDHIPLPMDEETFLRLSPDDVFQPEIRNDQPSCLVAQMIILNRILIEINNFHTSSAANPGLPTAHDTRIQELSTNLDDWHDSLPPYMHNTPENLQRYSVLGLGRIFVAVYLGYYHFGQLLFYQYLHEDCQAVSSHDNEQSAHIYSYAEKCKAYASSLCDLVSLSHQTPNCDVLYTMVGHNLVISSTILIHTLLFSSSAHNIDLARSRLEKNFSILLKLRNFWPVLEISFEAFRTFRETCKRDMETAYRMDDWMVKFLYGFANKVQDKALYDDIAARGEWQVREIGFSPRDWTDRVVLT